MNGALALFTTINGVVAPNIEIVSQLSLFGIDAVSSVATSADALPPLSRTLANGWKARAIDNIAAIRLAQQIVKDGRRPTKDEREVLARFVGFGATELATSLFPIGKAPVRAGWEDIDRDLRSVVSDADRAMLARSTQYAHYTPDYISTAIWDLLQRLGFSGGRVLEPGCGIGLFMQTAPQQIAPSLTWLGVEMDATTAMIARALNPDAKIAHEDFTKFRCRPVDLAVGNPPFASTHVTGEGVAGKRSLRLHDYFIARSLELVRPGGLAAFVTSHGTADKSATSARYYIGSLADLVGAIRLPQGSMAKDAGTDVVVDLLFFRRLEGGQQSNIATWSDVVEVTPKSGVGAKPMSVNRYFAEHPDMVLGAHDWTSSQFGQTYTCISANLACVEHDLKTAIDVLARGIGVQATVSGLACSSASNSSVRASATTKKATALGAAAGLTTMLSISSS